MTVDFLGHAGFMFRFKGKTVMVDPYRVSDNVPKADIILVTHGHSDHCSIKDVQKVSKKGTMVLCSVDCQSTLMKVKGIELDIVSVEDLIDFGFMRLTCVPAYTFGEKHLKREGWMGYVLSFDNKIFYVAGDTDNIPEMQRLSGYGKKGNSFVVMLPVAGGVVMNAYDAVKVASQLNPTLAIPMSYGSGLYGTEKDAQLFLELCKQKGINAQMLPKI